jgi:DNA modification methylase
VGVGVIILGDCLTVLKTMESESVHCCVTSPPYYGLRDYGVEGQLGLEPTLEEYIEKMVAVFREVKRVLRNDGTLWMNMGDTYAASRSYQVVDNKYKDVGNKIGHSLPPGYKQKDLMGVPWRLAFALQADGWYLRSDIIWHKPNPMPESVTDRPTKSHEYVFLLSKNQKYYYNQEAVREESINGGMAVKMPDGMATHKGGHGSFHKDGREKGANNGFIQPTRRNLRTVWTIATQPFPEAHFATFPQKLVEPCIKAGCPEGGTVLDPFAGSGTTGLVAYNLGREFIGIELNPDYHKMAENRISKAMAQGRLF